MNTEKQVRLEILSQSQKDLQTQIARIKQTLERVLDQVTSLAKRIRILFKEQDIAVFSIPNTLSMTIATFVLTITGVFGGGGGARGTLSKDKETLKK